MAVPLHDLKLPPMVWARLAQTKYHPRPYQDGEDVVARGARELLKIRYIGWAKLLMIRAALAAHGLTLEIPADVLDKIAARDQQHAKKKKG